MRKVTIYTKYCLDCMWAEEWLHVTSWLQHERTALKVKRTTYRPDWHQVATKLYGSEDYTAFVVFNEEVIDFMEFAKDCKNKLVELGKTKEIRDDMQGLPRTKGHDRKTRVRNKAESSDVQNAKD